MASFLKAWHRCHLFFSGSVATNTTPTISFLASGSVVHPFPVISEGPLVVALLSQEASHAYLSSLLLEAGVEERAVHASLDGGLTKLVS